jgi:hypothetical protein
MERWLYIPTEVLRVERGGEAGLPGLDVVSGGERVEKLTNGKFRAARNCALLLCDLYFSRSAFFFSRLSERVPGPSQTSSRAEFFVRCARVLKIARGFELPSVLFVGNYSCIGDLSLSRRTTRDKDRLAE